jgi:hypothetical protein
MRIIIGGVWGFVIGILYALIAYVLLTPILRYDLFAVLIYGIQGLIFGVSYVSIQKLYCRNKLREYCNHINSYLIIGAISGVITSSLSISITVYNSIFVHKENIASELKTSIIKALIYYEIGCLSFGVLVGLILFNLKKNNSETR